MLDASIFSFSPYGFKSLLFQGCKKLVFSGKGLSQWKSLKGYNKIDVILKVIFFSFLFLSAIFLFLACVIYPSGWDNDELQTICGPDSGKYRMGDCNIRWAYILAILGIFDAGILAVLAFFLASKRAKIEMYTASGAVTKCKLLVSPC